MPGIRPLQDVFSEYRDFLGEVRPQMDPLDRPIYKNITSRLKAANTQYGRLSQVAPERAQEIAQEVIEPDTESTIQKLLKPFTYEERTISRKVLGPILDQVGLINMEKLKDKKDIYFEDLLAAGGMDEGWQRTVLGTLGGWAISPSSWVTLTMGGALRTGIKVAGRKLTPTGMAKYGEILQKNLTAAMPANPEFMSKTAKGVEQLGRISHIAEKKSIREMEVLAQNGTLPEDLFERAGAYFHVPFTDIYKRVPGQDAINNTLTEMGFYKAMQKRLEPVMPAIENVARSFSRYAFRTPGNVESVIKFHADLANSNGLPTAMVTRWFTKQVPKGKNIENVARMTEKQDNLLALSWERIGQVLPRDLKKEKLAGYFKRIKGTPELAAQAQEMGMQTDDLLGLYKTLAQGYDHGLKVMRRAGITINDIKPHYAAHIYNLKGLPDKQLEDMIFGSMVPQSLGKERYFETMDDALSVAREMGVDLKMTTSATQGLNLWLSSVYKTVAYKNFLKNMVEKGGVKALRPGFMPVKSADDISKVLTKVQEEGGEIADAMKLIDDMPDYTTTIAKKTGMFERGVLAKEGEMVWREPKSGIEFTGPRNAIKDMQELLTRNRGYFSGDELNYISRKFRDYTNAYKKWVTIYFPAFANRNAISDMSRVVYQHGIRTLDPTLQRHTFSILTGFDPLGYANKVGMDKYFITDKMGRVITGKEIKRNFIKDGLFSFDIQRADLENHLKEVVTGGGKGYRVDKRYLRGMEKYNVYVENHNKMLNYIAELTSGKGFEEAAESTRHFLYDYRMLPGPQKFMRKYFPFWNWTYNNTKFMINRFFSHPGQQAAWMRSMQAGEQAVPQALGTEPFSEKEKRALPSFFHENLTIPLYRTATGAFIFQGLDLPIEELNEYGLAEGPTRTLQKVIGTRLNPYIKGAVELLANTDFFYNTKLTGKEEIEGETKYPMTRGYPLYNMLGINWLYGTEVSKGPGGEVRYNVDAQRKKVVDTLLPQSTRFMATFGKLSETLQKISQGQQKAASVQSLSQLLPLTVGVRGYERNIQQDQRRKFGSIAEILNNRLLDARKKLARSMNQ